MIGRQLPPTYSPLTAAAVLAGRRSDAGSALTQHLRTRHGARDVLLTDSGTSALRVALTIVANRPGAPRLIALPAWSCYDLATAADGAGVEVVLYDLDPTTLAPQWDSFDAALGHNPAGVVVVHSFGIPAPIAEARRRADAVGTVVIEDAAQAVGAELDGRPAGSHGELAILSFGRGKGWTGGGGGALLLGSTARPELKLPSAETLDAPGSSASVVVKSMVQWGLGRPALYGIPASLPFLGLGQTVYHPPHPPRRPTATMAGMLLATEPLLAAEVIVRRRRAEQLGLLVRSIGAGTVPMTATAGTAGWLRLPIIPTDAVRAAMRRAEARRLGILPGYPIALANLPGFASRLKYPTPAPGAELLAARLHTIPVHSLVSDTDLGRIEQWLREAVGQ